MDSDLPRWPKITFQTALQAFLLAAVSTVSSCTGTSVVTPSPSPVATSMTQPTASPVFIPTTLPTPTGGPSSTLPPVMKPTGTITPFDFDGPIVVTLLLGEDMEQSSVWLLTDPYAQATPLMEFGGASLGETLLSPAGQSLAYSLYQEDAVAIWVLDLVSRESVQWSGSVPAIFRVRQGVREFRTGLKPQSWSRDGQVLVYQAWDKEAPLDQPVWSYSLEANGEPRELGSRIVDLSWSPINPSKVAYLAERKGILMSDISAPGPPVLMRDIPDLSRGSIAWNPDGRHVAAVVGGLEKVSLWLGDLETGEWLKVEDRSSCDEIDWSPNGELLLCLSNEATTVLTVEGEALSDYTTLSRLPDAEANNEKQYWLADSNYIGLIVRSNAVSGGLNLCFYTSQGEYIACPLQAYGIAQQLGLSDALLRMTVSWAP